MKFRKAIRNTLAAALAVAAMVSCARSEMTLPDRTISFQVANRSSLLTRADADPEEIYGDTPFGAYSWFKGGGVNPDVDFMTNQKVIFDGTVWRPDGMTYYWPNGGSLDFFCYSPFSSENGPAVAENSVSWTDWSIAENAGVDLMYGTKAIGMTAPVTTYYYNGVPTLFHHALAKVGVKLRLAYNEVLADTGDKTRWDVTVHSIKLKGIYGKGSLTLNIGEDGKEWAKPSSNVWTTAGEPEDISLDVSGLPVLEDTALREVGTPMMVLPQAFGSDQLIDMEVTIRTWRDKGEGYELFITEDHVHIGAHLAVSSLSSWGINQNITYIFVLSPCLATGLGTDLDGDGIEDQEPTVILFDPAVGDWENISLTTSIQF